MDRVLTTRAATDEDADALIALVGAAYDEYPGCVLDLDDLDVDLLAPASTISRIGGRWWVVTDGDRVVGTVAAGPLDASGALELKRLYVAATHRRRGLASHLGGLVEERARELGASRVVLWSDSRFLDAHQLYARLGYVDTGERRELHDLSHTTEVGFVKAL